jgi:F-type H+-transporting ATPase subunit delta
LSVSTKNAAVADLYARALLELAESQKLTEAIDQEFSEFVAYLRIESDFRDFFESRMIDPSIRRESLERMFRGKMSDLLLNTLQVLNRRGRGGAVVEMQQRYHALLMEAQSIVEVQVTSARPLSEATRARVQQMAEQRTGKRVSLVEHIAPEIIGGLIIRVGDQEADASVARQLRRFHDTLLDHASKNIHAGTERFLANTAGR